LKNGLADYISRVHLLDPDFEAKVKQASAAEAQLIQSTPSPTPSPTPTPPLTHSSVFLSFSSTPRSLLYGVSDSRLDGEQAEVLDADKDLSDEDEEDQEEYDENITWSPNPDADEEQKLLDLIDQFERSSTEYDIDADPLLEERVLHQINLFTESHKKIPLKHLTNSEDKLAVLTELHKFHANPKLCAPLCCHVVSLGSQLGKIASILFSAVKLAAHTTPQSSPTPPSHRFSLLAPGLSSLWTSLAQWTGME
jgi:lipopolysaccharide export LptBFGC system permease protein LptF